ncbi:MAG TPA: isoleucine--tRNA ligase, partial [archaeon]|nr:isoleucine--tRNA ligase [archaeon]
MKLQPKSEEDKTIQFWNKEKIYEKSKDLRKNKKKFYFLDGPPYATGYIHVGTAFNKVLKDCHIRFFRMFGFNVWDQPGYDTHGVPIENKVEKKLGFKTKKDIEKFGIENFIKECKKFATEFIDVMGSQFSNLGVWMDWKKPYLTLDNDYIEGAWFTFKKAFEKGFLYKGNYPVHICPHCETAVAYNEIEYAKITDTSIYVKFKVKRKSNEYVLIWTTTPWTLPANTGVMAKPDAEYVKVKTGDDILILAKQLLDTVFKKVGIIDYEILGLMTGKQLEGLEYEHPLSGIFTFQKKLKNAHRVVLSDQFVTLEEGTGLVHTAPGHGQEDYKVGLETGLPAVSPVRMDGTFDDNCGKYSNVFVKDADQKIIEELRSRGLLFHEEKITHDYPLCWRCDSPLLLISIPQWFFKVTAIRERLLEENKKVKWVPDWAGQRFQNWLENLGDWPISRQRYWGIPLPIWVCEKCDKIKVVDSRKELPKIPKDFHRPYIDEIFLKCECGGKMKRVPEVLDVWFDSGVASWASLGYPNNKTLFKKLWPADFILEGPDQIRGWWNSLIITSMMTFDKAPFKSVLFHGFVMDAHGKQMSKSRGNVVTPEEVIEKYGRDVLRFYYLSSAPWDDYYFKWQDVEDIAKSFLVIRNTFNFVKTYVPKYSKPKKLEKEDRWVLSMLNSLIDNCTKNNTNLLAYRSAQEIKDFILNDFSRWYIKIIRDRVWPDYTEQDKQAAFYTLLEITETLSRLLAPFNPFLSEQVYQEIVKPLKGGLKSVHMCDWPEPNKRLVDKKLEESMEIVKKIFESCASARNQAKIKLRWPVKQILVFTKNKNVDLAVKQLNDVLSRMCNSKSVSTVKAEPKGEFSFADFEFGKVFVDRKLDKNLLEQSLIRELVRQIQDMRKKSGLQVKDRISLTLNSSEDVNTTLEKNAKELMKEVGASKVAVGKLQGKHTGSLEFDNKKIEIAFDKL